MKKIKSTLILGLLALFVIVGGVHATEQKIDVYEGEKLVKSVVFAIGLDEYYINNQLPGIKMDAAPFIEQDRTFIPVRYLGYALGLTEKDIAWDQENQKATLKGKTVLEMTINQKEIVTNGKAENIDVAPILKTEPAPRTYLPARYVAEGLGFQVDWDPDTRTVICWPQG
ncbi:MAG: copper amine oxidase N-terminal domain-containing protein, partial [Syntrophomonadaceae bacterium]|nr:copper amine oxidase N-terminal domain-containing protein [Syntrophomonadaceae bacterium]